MLTGVRLLSAVRLTRSVCRLVQEKETFPGERKKIKAAFKLFDRDNKDVVVKEEIGTIMRYLGAYPTEEELVTDILPQIQVRISRSTRMHTHLPPL